MRCARGTLLLALLMGCSARAPAPPGPGDTRLFKNEIDGLILCANNGFVMNVAAEAYAMSGRFQQDPVPPEPNPMLTGVATDGETGEVAFNYRIVDGTLFSDELAPGPWNAVSAFDRPTPTPDGQCGNLETRSWWTSP